jgi:drug/metabolite transporter (DMT)-like permease
VTAARAEQRNEFVLRGNGPAATRRGERHGVALVLLSAACFGALGVLSQLAYRAGVPVLGLLWGRYLIAATVLWLLVAVKRRPVPRRRSAATGVALGTGYSAQALLFAESLRHLEAGLADLLYFAYPALVVVLATVLRRERWSGRRAGATAVTIGALVVGLIGGGRIDPGGVTLALLAALGYAGYVVASSSLLNRTDPLGLAALLCTGAVLALGADALARGDLILRGGVHGALLVVAAALLSTVLGIAAFLAGVQRLGPARASIVSSVEPALTAVFGFAVFEDRFGPLQLLGAGLAFGAVLILEVRPHGVSRFRQRASSRRTASGTYKESQARQSHDLDLPEREADARRVIVSSRPC